MKKMFVNFKGNVKKYVDYLMSVNFGELFVNVLILICILLLSTFIFVPIGMVESIIRDFINLFVDLPNLVDSIYSWVFTLISSVLSVLAFVYMFNKRFEDIEAFKKQMKEKPAEKEVKKDNDDELELPKAKNSK
jgi:phosphotransferase system  glucose/maltose/N-acetylglucosamine-specific IIC component